ncbi:hypothetical protein D3C78_1343430 [compost metagenome]
MGEQPALTEFHPFTAEQLRLGFELDAFGNHLQIQRLGHVNDVRGDAAAGRVMAQCINECFVDLQAVHWQGLQVGEAAIAGAEIVDQHLMANIAQRLQVFPCHHHINQATFGDLEGNLPRRHAMQCEQPRHDLADAWHHHVAGCQVDRDV